MAHLGLFGVGAALIGLLEAGNPRSLGNSDTLTVNGLGGGDTINATPLVANVVKLTADGGIGNDTLDGGPGQNIIIQD
jgi:hypothetical protein